MKKSTLIALVVFSALALAWVATREAHVSAGVHHLNVSPLPAEAITAIELSGANTLTLQGVDGGWVAGGFSGDAAQAQALARALGELTSPEFVTERAERQAELELDAAKGVAVTVRTAAGVARELVVGKSSKSGATYVRLPGTAEVYSTAPGLAALVRRPLRDFRDKHITTAKLVEVTRVQVETPTPGQGFSLTKNGEAWQLEGTAPPGFRFDAEAASRLVGQATSLLATDFIDTPAAATDHETSLVLTLSNGGSRVLHLGEARADGTSVVRVDGEAQQWVIASWQAAPLRAGLEGLRDLKLLRAEPKDVTRLTVFAGPGKATGVVVREAGGWRLVEPKQPPAGFEFDPQQVDAQLNRLLSLRGTQVAQVAPAKAAFTRPAVELQLRSGAKLPLFFGGPTGTPNELYAKGSDGLVLIASSANQAWLEAGVGVFKKQPAPPTMGGLQGLDSLPPDIRAKLEAQLRAQQP